MLGEPVGLIKMPFHLGEPRGLLPLSRLPGSSNQIAKGRIDGPLRIVSRKACKCCHLAPYFWFQIVDDFLRYAIGWLRVLRHQVVVNKVNPEAIELVGRVSIA